MEESRHAVNIAVTDRAGALVARAGDPGLVAFARSAIKPLQALPVLDDGAADRFDFTPEDIALCCASHSSEPFHVERVRALLQKIGLTEDDLACGPHAPYYAPAAEALIRAGVQPGRVHNNCSGKHTGMLALARVHEWPTANYHLPEHPVQQCVAGVV